MLSNFLKNDSRNFCPNATCHDTRASDNSVILWYSLLCA